jgi:RNA polymerase sigma-54 factor
MAPSLSQGPQQNLTTRQYLTPLMHQSLTVLTLSAAALSQHLKDVACANPLLSYHEGRLPLTSNADLNWIPANDGQTLADKLLEQARLTSLDARTRSGLLTLITALDDAGYLRQPLAELQAECGVPATCLDAALDQLQQFDPAGVGARDLCECLWLQAVRRDDFDAVATTILAEGQLGILATPEQWGQLPYTKAELETALAAIRRLDPAPGHQFAGNAGTLYVTPDLLWTDDEQLVMATEQLPQLTFDQAYYDSLLAAADKATKRYLRQQREQYRQLDNSLQQRARNAQPDW